jgi:nickel/cobalt transporter (NicO) family protein
MTRALLLTIALCGLLLFPEASSARNPFQPPPTQQEKSVERGFSPGDLLPERVRAAGQKAMAVILLWQARIRQAAAEYARHIRENPWGPALWSYLMLAFAYGVIHALGPGHGKVFVSTYFLSRRATVWQTAIIGSLIGGLHVLSATILVLLFYFILKTGALGSVTQTGAYLQQVSSALICGVGLFLAGKSLRTLVKGNREAHGHCDPAPSGHRNVLSLGLAVGLVPCPGAALILFFSITLGILPAGLLAMIFLAAGLALTTTAFALVSLLARQVLEKITTARTGFVGPRLATLPTLIGAVLITLLGAVLFFNPIL